MRKLIKYSLCAAALVCSSFQAEEYSSRFKGGRHECRPYHASGHLQYFPCRAGLTPTI